MKKITITFKDPDGVFDRIRDQVVDEVEGMEGLSKIEKEDLIEARTDELNEKLSKWIQYGEYLDVEFDLENMTAKVKEV